MEKIWHQGNRDTVFGMRWDVNVLPSAFEDVFLSLRHSGKFVFPLETTEGGRTLACKIAGKKTDDGR